MQRTQIPQNGNVFVFSAVLEEQKCLQEDILALPNVSMFPAGVGLVDFAFSLGQHTMQTQPDMIIFLGTCGSRLAQHIGDVIVPNTALLYDARIEHQRAYWPKPMKTHLDLFIPPYLGSSHLPGVVLGGTVASPLAISDTHLIEPVYDWENLEVFAASLAGFRLSIPVMAILGVSNQIGPNAHDEWKKFRSLAEKKSCELARDILQKIV